MMNQHSDLDITLLRLMRRRKRPLPRGLGENIDTYEAQQNELQLALQMLTSQSAIERQKAEEILKSLTIQIKVAEDQILSFMNAYQKQQYDKLFKTVKISEESLKFKGTDIYDMSFITNMDYSKVTTFNDSTLLQKRPDRREQYRQLMKEYKDEVSFADGLIRATDEKDKIIYDLYSQKNYFLKQYYLAAIAFYQEVVVIGFLYNPTNNLENLKEYIEFNDKNIPIKIQSLNDSRLKIGEEAYLNEIEKIRYIEKMVLLAKLRYKYLKLAYDAKWTPPTLESINEFAVKNDLTYSRAVYELNQKSRETLCIPDWVLAIAELYNQIAIFEEGSHVVDLNPYDSRWIRKAKEVINLEAEGVEYAAQKLFKAINEYWVTLTFGFQELEDHHLEAIIEMALKENLGVIDYRYTNNFTPVDFDDVNQSLGFSFNPFKAISNVVNKTVKLVKNAAGVLVDASRIITKPVAKAVKATLDNTLGRVLPDSIYKKIETLTDTGLRIVQLHLDKKTFRGIVDSVMVISLVNNRITEEMFKLADKTGVLKIDKFTGGVITSYRNLNKVPVTLSTGGKIDWRATAIDAIKVIAAASAGATAFATQTAVNATGSATGLDKTKFGMGVLSASALIATGQSNFATEAAKGATVVGTKSVINSTGLGDSSLGRSIATIGVSAAVTSVQTNEAFTQLARDKAEDELKKWAKKSADDALKKATGGIVTTDLIEKGYDFYNSDKTISGIIDEAKQKFDQKYNELINKAEKLTMEEIKDKAAAEADRFVQKRLNELYDLPAKYGEKLVEYLMKKYGPRADYDDVIQPDDFLNYQIDQTLPGQRIFNTIVYTKNSAGKVFLAVTGIAAASYLALD